MTAIYAMTFEDCICILSDGAATSYADETVVALMNKVVRKPDHPFAIAITGDYPASESAAQTLIDEAESFDDLVEQTRRKAEEQSAWFTGGLKPPFRCILIIAGWSPRLGFRLYSLCWCDGAPGFKPFSFNDEGRVVGIGPTEDMLDRVALAQVTQDFQQMGAAWFAERGGDLFELYRSVKVQGAFHPKPSHIVGGHVDLTVITREGCTTTRLRTWPDEIGSAIDPTRGAATHV